MQRSSGLWLSLQVLQLLWRGQWQDGWVVKPLQTRGCHHKDVDTGLALLLTAGASLETRSPGSQGKLSLASTA